MILRIRLSKALHHVEVSASTQCQESADSWLLMAHLVGVSLCEMKLIK